MSVARVNLSVRHPKRGYPMEIAKVDANGQRAKCPWVDKNGKFHNDWFAFKDSAWLRQRDSQRLSQSQGGKTL